MKDDAKLKSSFNPFEGIIDGSIPCKKVYENEDVLVFEDIAPKAPIHLLLIPKKKGILHLQAVEGEQMREVMAIMEAVKKVATKLNLTGYRLVTNVGYFGGQRVPHLHFHLLSGAGDPLDEKII